MSGQQSNMFNSQKAQAGRDVNNVAGNQENRGDTAGQIVNNPVKQTLKADVDQSVKNIASNNKNQVAVGGSNKMNEQEGNNNRNSM
ncbi:hypothetical protein LOK49_LG04G00640 [Camellia lanceoleosa]|uniref:Uncharacterized protein n=1 Tax=Camellia lanceoleosa TaxID=1840588 RepID=A0ACC0I0Z5_9ERIC|nr:hypothetical protein LOK49_LG04G00640 [Camellia lanceoleosa]